MQRIIVLLSSLAILVGCNSVPNVNVKAEEDQIRKLEADWIVLNQTKNVNKIMELYAPDAIIMAPGQSIGVGPEAVRKSFESAFADPNTLWETFSWTTEKAEVSASGDLGYVCGPNSINIKAPDGSIEESDKGVDIWRKIDGQWKCVLSIWNSSRSTEEMLAPVSTVEVFRSLEESWNNAVFSKDAKTLDLLYAKEYTFIGTDGKVYDRQQDISEVVSANYKAAAPSVLGDITVNSYGNVAIVKGVNTVKATMDGKDISGKFRFVDVFVMRDGRWQCVSTQSSRLPGK
jgi:ketosteroid isomerase-like protein